MVYITVFGDLKRIPYIHALFKRQTQIEQPANPPGPAPAAQPAP
jgi:hypothetical protein